jgi:predicted metal-dependent hydrolase
MAEQSQVQYGNALIRFRVQRSQRRKQVSLVVEPGRRQVLVLAPAEVDLARIRAVVRARGAWVIEKLKAVQGREPSRAAHEFVSGESFAYLGRSFRLRVREATKPEQAVLEGAWLTVTVSPGLSAGARARAARAAVIAWYKARAVDRLPERLARFVEHLDVSEPRVLLRDQARRWGSCSSKGEVRLNWRIVQASMKLVDYVVAHEAVHLVHRNHTTAFWRTLGRLVPDVDDRRADLVRRGPGLVW